MSDNTNNGFPVPEEPLTREEEYLSAIAGVTASTEIPEKPLTRIEAYLDKIVENGGGGGGGGTVNNAKITIQKNGTDVESFTLNQSTDETINISGIAEADSNGQIEAATVKAGALEDGMTATTQATSDDSTKLATTAYVHDVVDALPEPMIFTGSITLTADSTDTSTAAITVSAPASAADIVKGYTYKVTSIASSPVYTGSIKVGDTLIAAKNAPTVSASWVADTDWTIVPSGDETGYVVGLPSGTSSGQLMAFGADGYTAANSGVSVANNTTGISDVDKAVPTSKAVIHKTAHAATLDDYTPETGTYTDKITTADTIDTAIKKLDTRSRANETNISLLTPTVAGGVISGTSSYSLLSSATLNLPNSTGLVYSTVCRVSMSYYAGPYPTGMIISRSNDSSDFDTVENTLAKFETTENMKAVNISAILFNAGNADIPVYFWLKTNGTTQGRVYTVLERFR